MLPSFRSSRRAPRIDEKSRRYFRKAGTVTQVKFWLIQYLNEGYMTASQAARTLSKGMRSRMSGVSMSMRRAPSTPLQGGTTGISMRTDGET